MIREISDRLMDVALTPTIRGEPGVDAQKIGRVTEFGLPTDTS
jgi:hypothetical protein